MTTRNLAQFIQNAVRKDKSPIADCAACVATSFGGFGRFGTHGADKAPHAADGPKKPGLLDKVPWPWIIGTLVVSVPATAFLTYKMTESMAKSKLGLKLFERTTAAKRRKKRKRKSRRR